MSRSLASRVLLAGAIVIPALAGCEAGYGAPTLNFHPAAFGAYATTAGVSISNAFVLGPALNQSLPAGSNASVFLSVAAQSGDTLESVTAPGVAASVQLSGGPVTVPAYGAVNLTGPAPKVILTGLTRPLQGGQTVTIDFTFANAGTIAVQVPVQPHAYSYATYQQAP